MVITLAGSRTAQQEAWLNDALAGLLYDYEHPALPCSVTVLWVDQDTLQALGDHGLGVYFAFTQVSESTLSATISIWDGLDTNTGRFSGKDFYMETVAHELGHVVAGVRSTQHPSLQTEFATMVSGSGSWTGGQWEERYLEAFAEIFKDVFLPGRKFDNRTAHKLNRGRFDAYLALVNAAEKVHTAPHIDYDLDPGGEHAQAGFLYGDPSAPNSGHPGFWAIRGGIDAPFDWDAGITGGTFTPVADRGALTAVIGGFDLTMTPNFELPYAQNDDIANPPPPDPAYDAQDDPTNWEYVGWDNGWWNTSVAPAGDPFSISPYGRRVFNEIFGWDVPIGAEPASDLGGPLFFVRWEIIDPNSYVQAEEVQAFLDLHYSFFDKLAGQTPAFSGALTGPPDLTTLGFDTDIPLQLRIGTSARTSYTEIVGDEEVQTATVGDDVRPAGPGVTEEWHSREFTVTFLYRFSDPAWPYPTSITWASPVGPKTRRVQYQGNGWGNRRGSNRRFVGVPSPTVNLDK